MTHQQRGILSYNLGDLKLVVRVPIACTMPTVDDEDMPHPGMAVQCSTANAARQHVACGAGWSWW